MVFLNLGYEVLILNCEKSVGKFIYLIVRIKFIYEAYIKVIYSKIV